MHLLPNSRPLPNTKYQIPNTKYFFHDASASPVQFDLIFYPDMNIPLTPVRFLRYAQQQFPRKTAIVCGADSFTYAEFGDRAARLAGALREAGIQAGDRVAFLSTNCHRLLEAYYGVLEAGAVLLPLNIRLTPNELAYILNDAGATILFVEQQFLGLVESFHDDIPSVKMICLLEGPPEAPLLSPRSY